MNFSAARLLLADAVHQAVTPAAVVEVGQGSGALWRECFGRFSYEVDAHPTQVDTIFDLASLTKVMATTSIVMRAVGAGRLTLDTPVGALLDGWSDGLRAAVHVRHLLDHSSGLPAHLRLWESARGRPQYEAALRAVPIERTAGSESVYSDLGFIVLGFLVESALARPLDEEFAEVQKSWDGTTTYNPPSTLRDRIAPTEYDPERASVVQGEVHDENARALGGVAGHAGLFGTAADVGAFARLVLRTFREPTGLGTPSLMRTFAAPSDVAASSRALGWDTMRSTSSCGALMSPGAIGHTGFTGTSLWIDPARDLYVVLLMNRIHPTRTNDAHLALRPRVHDAIVTAVNAGR